MTHWMFATEHFHATHGWPCKTQGTRIHHCWMASSGPSSGGHDMTWPADRTKVDQHLRPKPEIFSFPAPENSKMTRKTILFILSINNWLVVWNIFYFPFHMWIICGMSSFPLTFSPSFFRGVGWNHQADKLFVSREFLRSKLETSAASLALARHGGLAFRHAFFQSARPWPAGVFGGFQKWGYPQMDGL